jgi:hypothetical protein
LEAEGKAFRRGMLRTGAGLACLGAAALLLLAGLSLCLWALFQWLTVTVGMPMAALWVGVILFVIGGGLTWIAIRLNR